MSIFILWENSVFFRVFYFLYETSVSFVLNKSLYIGIWKQRISVYHYNIFIWRYSFYCSSRSFFFSLVFIGDRYIAIIISESFFKHFFFIIYYQNKLCNVMYELLHQVFYNTLATYLYQWLWSSISYRFESGSTTSCEDNCFHKNIKNSLFYCKKKLRTSK